MSHILTPKGIVTIIISTAALYGLSLCVNYLYLELFLLLLLTILFITALKTENEIIANIFGNLLFVSVLYSVPHINKIDPNRLFNFGIIFISFLWIFIFNRYFKLEEEERLPILVAISERRDSREAVGTIISLGFLKVIFDLQILDANITISKEVLSNFYSINSQLFGIIFTAVIVITAFIAGEQGNVEHRKKNILVQCIKGILLFAIPIIFLSICGILLDMDLRIGKDMLPIQNTLVTWIFSMTVLMSIFCILFMGLLIHDLLDIEGE
jgi:hypothetical protein